MDGASTGMLENDGLVKVERKGYFGSEAQDVRMNLDVQNHTGVYYVKIIADRTVSTSPYCTFFMRDLRVFPIYKEMEQ